MTNTDTTKTNSSAHDGEAVPASYKTPTVLLIYIVKSSKSIVGDREKKRKRVIEVKDPLSFEIWIFRNGQTVRDDNRSIFVAITST